MSEAIINVLVTNLFEVVASIISIIVATIIVPGIKNQLIPWLVEKRLYNIVAVGVQAAEKLARAGQLDSGEAKKKYVLLYLRQKNITITPEIETFIESVCQELDTIAEETFSAFYPEPQIGEIIEDTEE